MNDKRNDKKVRIPSRIIRKMKKVIPKNEERWIFKTSREYWDTRYRTKLHGGKSGEGSIGENRTWKWIQIEKFVDVSNRSVVDVGCGDLSFWEGRNCASYEGIDFSKTIIEKNRLIKPDWKFIQGDASNEFDFAGEAVFCFDVLFHIMSDEIYFKILQNLAKWTKKWLFIYTWHKTKFGDAPTDGNYQYFRPLLESLNHLAPLKLVDSLQQDEYGTLYVFTRSDDQ